MAAKGSATSLRIEIATAFAIGAIVAWTVPPAAFERMDDLVVVYISIVVATSVPGIAITATAARPKVNSARDAREIGAQLSDQVRFWLGFLLWGSIAAGTVIIGHACKWELNFPPRLSFTPAWVPAEGGRWLMFAATFAVAFMGVRTRRLARAAIDLVDFGTQNQIAEVAEQRQVQAQDVGEQIAAMPTSAERGKPIERPH